MADNFGPHSPKGGGRLDQIQGLGRPNLGRRFVDAEVRRAEAFVEDVLAPQRLEPAGLRSVAEKVSRAVRLPGEKNKGGRPGLGAPWLALGISRAEYFRRRKKGGGG
jgi:hypothetical protein